MPDNLTPDVRALIQAAAEALNIPLPALTADDDRAYQQTMAYRASTVKHALRGVLEGMQPLTGAAYIDSHAAESPVTYAVWTGDES